MPLSEKDQYCIARHISSLVEDSKYNRDADDTKACHECKHALDDTCTGYPGVLDPWPAFSKLSEATGVLITPYRKKVKNLE